MKPAPSAPDISVMIVTYNQAATVARAIESVLAQRLGPYRVEIVIADDGSTDDTRTIAAAYARRFPAIVRLLPEAPNRGLVSNYFTALRACRGRYIADCAGDDFWLCPDRLRFHAALLDARPDVSIVYSRYIEVVEGSESPKAGRCPAAEATITDGRRMMEPLLAHVVPQPIHLSASLFRADTALAALREDCEWVCNPAFRVEDLPLLLALLARGRSAFIPLDALAYTVGQESVSKPSSFPRMFDYYASTLRMTIALARRYRIASLRLLRFIIRRAVIVAKLRIHLCR